MPAVAAHCLAYSKVVSGAKLRMLRTPLETMRFNPRRRETNPVGKKMPASDMLRAASACVQKDGHTREPTSCPLAFRVVIFIQSPWKHGTPKVIGLWD